MQKCESRRFFGSGKRTIRARWNFLKKSSRNKISSKKLKLQRFYRHALRCQQQLSVKRTFRRAFLQSLFGGKTHDFRVIIFVGDVRHHEITRTRVESIRVG